MRRTGSVMPATVRTIDGLAAAVVDTAARTGEVSRAARGQPSSTAMIAMKIGEVSVEKRMPSRANERPTLYRAA